MSAITLWTLSGAFTKSLRISQDYYPTLGTDKKHRLQKWLQVDHQYQRLKNLAHMMNETIGGISLLFFLNFLFYYPSGFDELFTITSDWKNTVSFVFYFCGSCMFLVISSSVCKRVILIFIK